MSGRYFFRDEFNGDFFEFDKLEDAQKHADQAIIDLDGESGWPQEVLDGAFQIGIILQESCETNRRENDVDEDGEDINSEFDFLCEVEMADVENNLVGELKKYKDAYQVLKLANEFYANTENCNNPEGCFIYEVDTDGEEISDEGYTALKAKIKVEEILNGK